MNPCKYLFEHLDERMHTRISNFWGKLYFIRCLSGGPPSARGVPVLFCILLERQTEDGEKVIVLFATTTTLAQCLAGGFSRIRSLFF